VDKILSLLLIGRIAVPRRCGLLLQTK